MGKAADDFVCSGRARSCCLEVVVEPTRADACLLKSPLVLLPLAPLVVLNILQWWQMKKYF
ncbi:hypothetical protein CDL15_Pgr011192 [Punica granatum]|uniref:Uncharacterized protein n=1 Tax=Punica granatum TaxID=22663 RepID=A0A218WE20_PUNGR|nr:hypothetical protein CDL15_Pgr011192 [Punica granatum]